uniref:Ubiquitin-like with PHD and RING finger domains 2 n=1 Tax=Sphaerodactylus townsendi TaxID=933632 RepID=A0ACB8ERF0_9SAUR
MHNEATLELAEETFLSDEDDALGLFSAQQQLTDPFSTDGAAVIWECPRYPESGIVDMTVRNLRPRARTILKWNELRVGDMVMVNYNVESPEERGFWFDAEITSLREISRTNKEIYAKIMLG